MSRNITIQEGGVGKQLTVDKLKTNLVGGGTCMWVPEDDVALGSKRITENGTYRASDDGFYGYSQVTVSGVSAAAGKIASGSTPPTSDGNEYGVTANSDGELVFQKLPSYIQVTTQPTKTDYTDGEAIDFTGMVVTAYDDNGESMGVVASNELILPDTVADISGSGEGKTVEIDSVVYNGTTYNGKIIGINIPSGTVIGTINNGSTPVNANRFNDDTYFTWVYDGNTCYIVSASASNSPYNGFWLNAPGYGTAHSATKIEHNGKTAYVYTDRPNIIGSGGNNRYVTPNDAIPVSTVNCSRSAIGWMMLYGSEDGSITHYSGQEIRVQWNRPIDYKMLETHFGITVTETPQGEITRAEVEQAITTAQLLGLDVVYIRGVEYTMAEAITLRNSLS